MRPVIHDKPHADGRWLKVFFEPKEDITAFELAFIVSRIAPNEGRLAGIRIREDSYKAIPDGARRHLRREESTEQ